MAPLRESMGGGVRLPRTAGGGLLGRSAGSRSSAAGGCDARRTMRDGDEGERCVVDEQYRLHRCGGRSRRCASFLTSRSSATNPSDSLSAFSSTCSAASTSSRLSATSTTANSSFLAALPSSRLSSRSLPQPSMAPTRLSPTSLKQASLPPHGKQQPKPRCRSSRCTG